MSKQGNKPISIDMWDGDLYPSCMDAKQDNAVLKIKFESVPLALKMAVDHFSGKNIGVEYGLDDMEFLSSAQEVLLGASDENLELKILKGSKGWNLHMLDRRVHATTEYPVIGREGSPHYYVIVDGVEELMTVELILRLAATSVVDVLQELRDRLTGRM